MLVMPYTMIVHPNFGVALARELDKFCITTVVIEPDGSKIYRVEDVDRANPITLLQGELLALVGSVRFVEMEALPLSGDMSARIPAQKTPTPQKSLQELRKFLRLDRRARR